jgi:hypothetical protein
MIDQVSLEIPRTEQHDLVCSPDAALTRNLSDEKLASWVPSYRPSDFECADCARDFSGNFQFL